MFNDNVECSFCKSSMTKFIKSYGTGENVKADYRCLSCRKEFVYSPFVKKVKQAIEDESAKTAVFSGADLFDYSLSRVLEIYCPYHLKDEIVLDSGSAFIISKSGYIISNAHVVTKKESGVFVDNEVIKARFKNSGEEYQLLLINEDQDADLAVLKFKKLPENFNTVNFCPDSNKSRTGEDVYVIGNAKGLGISITKGIISDAQKTVNGNKLMQIDNAINTGNSGGPVFNTKKEVIAVVVSGYSGTQNISFCIPSGIVKKFIEKTENEYDIKILQGDIWILI